MPITKAEGERLGFIYAGEIRRNPDDGNLSFQYEDLPTFTQDHGWVYLWVKVTPEGGFDVCYVGKAGKTLKGRGSQHAAGFKRGSGRGSVLAQQLGEYLKLDASKKIHVYARKSPNQTVLDENDISMCETEERAMIMKLRRYGVELWNIV